MVRRIEIPAGMTAAEFIAASQARTEALRAATAATLEYVADLRAIRRDVVSLDRRIRAGK